MAATILNLEERLQRIEQALTAVSEGDFDQRIELSARADGLSGVEMGLNFLVLDLRAMVQANREKEEKLLEQQRELEAKLSTIEQQAAAIRELSTPVMEIWEDILVLPIVGVVDTYRSVDIMERLLEQIVRSQARCIIIDITGVEVVDTKTADYLLKVVRACALLGARCVLTGLSPAIAQTLVAIGADLTAVRTLRNLKDGLKDCLAFLRASRAQGQA